MSKSTEVLIVGGGIAGCATAYYLAQQGISSMIVESHGIGSKASGKSAGMLSPVHGAKEPGTIDEISLESFNLHQVLADELIEETGIDFSPRFPNQLQIAIDLKGMDEIRFLQSLYEKADDRFESHFFEYEELNLIQPGLTPKTLGGLLLKGNTSVNSELLTQALAKGAELKGSEVVNSTVTGINKVGQKIESVQVGNEKIFCDLIVLAMGPWTLFAQEWVEFRIPMLPLKGEILRVSLPNSENLLSHEIYTDKISIYPRTDGLVWIGATEQEKGFDESISEDSRKYLLNTAKEVFPEVQNASVDVHTACLRPIISDYLPLVDAIPSLQNAFIVTGGAKKGILLAPAMGKAISDMISNNGQTDITIKNYGFSRF